LRKRRFEIALVWRKRHVHGSSVREQPNPSSKEMLIAHNHNAPIPVPPQSPRVLTMGAGL